MNLIEELDLVFKENHMNDFEKIRYIYLYVCKKFSYDVRFIFALPSMKREIYNKEVDITHVEDFEIVCYTYSKILKEILDYYGYESEVIKEDSRSETPHAYVIAKLGNRLLRLDPVTKHDTTRVKMNIATYDFAPVNEDLTFSDDLEDADALMKRMNFFRGTSDAVKWNNWLASLNTYSVHPDPEIRFFNIFNAIISTMNVTKDLNRYDDLDYFFSYAIKKLGINEKRVIVKPATFFNDDDPSMRDMITIILVEYNPDLPIFYIIEPTEDGFYTRQIDSEEVLEKLSHYSNYVTDEYFKNAARKSSYRIIK